MPHVQRQWKDWYSGDTNPDPLIGGIGNFWLNNTTKGVWEKTGVTHWEYRGSLFGGLLDSGFVEISFSASDWCGNRITVIPTGVPSGQGEIGPHYIPPRILWPIVSENVSNKYREVGINAQFDNSTGFINIYKSARTPPFDGVVGIRFLPP